MRMRCQHCEFSGSAPLCVAKRCLRCNEANTTTKCPKCFSLSPRLGTLMHDVTGSGERILPDASPAVKAPTKARKPPAKAPDRHTPKIAQENTRRPATQPVDVDRIDGKWWTTGNGFGDSEVVFTQNGPQVTGTIRYADGRNGALTGTLIGKRLKHTWTNSSGDGGSGWLELSWTNFLGGPWRNQRVRNGSWTLNRIDWSTGFFWTWCGR